MQRHQVAPAPHRDYRRVRAAACRVHADDHGRAHVLVRRSPERFLDQMRRDELIVARAGELPVHLYPRLRAVFAVLVYDLLIDVLVCPLDRAGVNFLAGPEVAFVALDRLEEVPAVAPGVAEGEPVAVKDVLREEAAGHRPGPGTLWPRPPPRAPPRPPSSPRPHTTASAAAPVALPQHWRLLLLLPPPRRQPASPRPAPPPC